MENKNAPQNSAGHFYYHFSYLGPTDLSSLFLQRLKGLYLEQILIMKGQQAFLKLTFKDFHTVCGIVAIDVITIGYRWISNMIFKVIIEHFPEL